MTPPNHYIELCVTGLLLLFSFPFCTHNLCTDFIFLICDFYISDNLCFIFLVLVNHHHRMGDTPVIVKTLHTFEPYLTNKGFLVSLPFSEGLIILKPLNVHASCI